MEHGNVNGRRTGPAPRVTLEMLPVLDGERHRYTLRVDFTAIHADLAPAVAATLVLGLGTLCPHVETYSAGIAPAAEPERLQPVFCAAPGPEGVFCEDLHGHPGCHAEAGVNGLRWDPA